jgi:hypothetical protein
LNLPPFLALQTWRQTFETAAERSSLCCKNFRLSLKRVVMGAENVIIV